nr:phage portal protein [Schumannella luteola]
MDRLGLTDKRMKALASTIDLTTRSPWITGEDRLTTIAVAKAIMPDGAKVEDFPLSREEALLIPAVSRARNLLVSTIAGFPLVALDKNGPLDSERQPTFLYRDDQQDTPYERMAGTVDDCLFYGRALWLLDRGAGDSPTFGPVLNGTWLPASKWTITNGHVMVDEQAVHESEYLLFNIPMYAGLLAVGDRTLRGARDTEVAWTDRIKNPVAALILRVTDSDAMPEGAEIEDFVNEWKSATRANGAAVGYVPEGVEMDTHMATDDSGLFIENRNAIRTDVGSHLNLRPSMIDGTSGIDSLTYTTKDGERNAFYDFDLPFWTKPIEAALSASKIVPRGQRVRFDQYDAYNPPIRTGVPTEE